MGESIWNIQLAWTGYGILDGIAYLPVGYFCHECSGMEYTSKEKRGVR